MPAPTSQSRDGGANATGPGETSAAATSVEAERDAYRRRLEAVAENASLALFIMDEQQRCRYMNPAAERLTGFRLEELQGQALHYYVHHTRPDGTPYPLDECPIDRAFPQNMQEQGTEVFVHRSGHFYPVAFTASPIREDGRTVGTIIEVRDISDERAREEELARLLAAERAAHQERERLLASLEVERSRLATVFAQTPSVLAIVRGPEHVLDMANEAYLALNGHRDVLGKPLLEAVPELRGQGFDRLLDRVIATGEPYVGREVPIRLSTTPGSPPEERFFDFVYLPLVEPDESGVPARVGVIAHGNDITEQVRARREVERARERADRLQAITAALAATTTPEAVADLVVAHGVAAAGATTGMLALRVPVHAGDAGGHAGSAVILRQRGLPEPVLAEYGRFPVTAPGPAAACLRTGEAFFLESGAEVRARFPEIPHIWDGMGTEAVATVPLAVGGETVGAMSFTWTAPRRLPTDVREFFLALGGQAAQALERARLLAAERAARAEAEAAREAAEAGARAKAEFLAMMSHEIRTPINAIVGYTQLIELGVPDPVTPAQRHQLARVAASAQHLLGLVNDVLDVAKIDAGEMHVAREYALAGAAVEEALALVRPLASERGIRLVVRHGPVPHAPYVGDTARTRQILVNLLSNAVKFTPAGGAVAIEVGTVAEAPPEARVEGVGPWTYARVADTGVGIAPEQQAAVFEPFVQAETGHTRTKGGTGLGLTISRRLARLMGGDLMLESTPGVGSSFTLWLPAAGVTEAGETESAAERGERAGLPGGGWRVHGLAEIGRALREEIDTVLEAYAVSLRADPATPEAAGMPRPQLEDHAITLLADLAQSLVIVAEAGEAAAALMADGSAIQRAVAEHHGARRHAQGWSEDALRRDYDLLRETVERAVRTRVASHTGDVSEGLQVLARLQERTKALGIAAYRQAVALEATRAPAPRDGDAGAGA